ncbi:uncharacterized protein Z518_07504 [Rhinocladiella mackenziei CBS 650.93]|uniref:ATP phosphoribosyltransferase n=1 Tax=Rhinocladiella mackenziei CBS 650.93 TaxID=1442369 RepID=A0A0D2IL68_9EURO|nr:uncharacterized protein Z518_07504 [Rhinocladiella mackenziei CBS 650.93]KIX03951.1 hypothetical protein Z518_07504 [Rhinocladiella mackenziei CBS 650.93]
MPTTIPTSGDTQIYKLTFYVPPSDTQACLSAIWSTGAGTWPNPPGTEPVDAPAKYIETAFVSRGTGMFRPTAAANPHIGKPGDAEVAEEEKVEMVVVGTPTVKRAVEALRKAHPYEVVAFFVTKCESF